ncbi:MAG: hypothetical protein AN484_21085 [Aphanizomenon flos-aquae WA102]|uniref:Uncharacterized protein n=1 Tax=Aphanizomenon flos-aquae WA102 TaxID=1710896 RepID=A0A1B7WWH9_APHFL|nr:MAG: hypothetical protein AN484_21085 [Aphanizomenon flos-aquae WA102]
MHSIRGGGVWKLASGVSKALPKVGNGQVAPAGVVIEHDKLSAFQFLERLGDIALGSQGEANGVNDPGVPVEVAVVVGLHDEANE